MKNTRLTFAIVLVMIAMISLVYSLYTQNETIKDLKKPSNEVVRLRDSLYQERKECDSLKSEIFVRDIDLMRYVYIFERAEEELTGNCRDQLDLIMSQTE